MRVGGEEIDYEGIGTAIGGASGSSDFGTSGVNSVQDSPRKALQRS